jgi:serine phosphatase RsbU (regulator of sigma subunit)
MSGGRQRVSAPISAVGKPSVRNREDTQRRLEVALRSGHMGTYSWDPVSGRAAYDAPLLELYGFAAGEFGGQLGELSRRVHPEDRDGLIGAVQDAMDGRETSFDREFRVIHPNGDTRWLHGYGQVYRGEDDEQGSLVGVVVDVTPIRTAEMEREAALAAEAIAQGAARSSQRRLELLARAAALLDSPLDLDATLQQVADLAIGDLADWCAVDLETDHLAARRVAVSHRDPAMLSLAHELQSRYPDPPDAPGRLAVLRSLQPLHVAEVTDEMLVGAARDPAHLGLLRTLGMSSVILAPVQAGGRAFGVLSLVTTHGRRLGSEDVELAMELGRRAGATLEKVRLYAERDAVAQILQRSLLPPELPDIPALALAAFYAPAVSGFDIGGDFYDVFQTSADRWWLVLGDVCGKGPAAASLTGVIRYMIRAFALGGEPPGEVLRLLSEALLGQNWDGRFATLVLAVVDVTPAAETLVVRLATAGHPPPILKTRAGVRACGGEGMPVGLLPDLRVATIQVELNAGDTLVMYTDGATEARTAAGEFVGEDGLKQIVADAPADPSHLIASVTGQLRSQAPIQRDDLALLVFSWRPTSRPLAASATHSSLGATDSAAESDDATNRVR